MSEVSQVFSGEWLGFRECEHLVQDGGRRNVRSGGGNVKTRTVLVLVSQMGTLL